VPFSLVAKRSKKTRIETSNLLEKGLIQKQVYFGEVTLHQKLITMFLRSKNILSW